MKPTTTKRVEYWVEFLIGANWVRSLVKYHSLEQARKRGEIEGGCRIVRVTTTEKKEILK